jgi:uncharacterized protein YwgA
MKIMDQRLIVLELFLKALGVPVDIKTIDDRKRVQKAVYLGQLSGVDLGYRFGWYLMGPYSAALTRDYYALADAVASGEKDDEKRKLSKYVLERLDTIRPLLQKPDSFPLSEEDWLELVASLHFLRKISKLDKKVAQEILSQTKHALSQYSELAEKHLQKIDLL